MLSLCVKTNKRGLVISTLSDSFVFLLTNHPYLFLPSVFIDFWQVHEVIGVLNHGGIHPCYLLKGNHDNHHPI